MSTKIVKNILKEIIDKVELLKSLGVDHFVFIDSKINEQEEICVEYPLNIEWEEGDKDKDITKIYKTVGDRHNFRIRRQITEESTGYVAYGAKGESLKEIKYSINEIKKKYPDWNVNQKSNIEG